jgi:hypothetical protein
MAAELLLLPRPRSERPDRLPKPDRLRKLTRQNGDQSLRRDASELHLPRPSTERVADRRLSHSHLLCLLARQIAEEAALRPEAGELGIAMSCSEGPERLSVLARRMAEQALRRERER